MSKPETVRDLVNAGIVERTEIGVIASQVFDGKTQLKGPEGYVVTLGKWESLGDNVRSFIVKAFYDAKVTNILDAKDLRTEYEKVCDEEAEAARAITGLEQGDFGDE